jgi:hypothetical protein
MTQPNQHIDATVSPRFMRVRDVQAMLGCSKAFVFARLKAGQITAFKLDGILLIDRDSVEEYVNTAEPWTGGAT